MIIKANESALDRPGRTVELPGQLRGQNPGHSSSENRRSFNGSQLLAVAAGIPGIGRQDAANIFQFGHGLVEWLCLYYSGSNREGEEFWALGL